MNDEWMNGNLVTLIMYAFRRMIEFMRAFPTLIILANTASLTLISSPQFHFLLKYSTNINKYIQVPAMFQKKFHHVESRQMKSIDASYSDWVLANIKVGRRMKFPREGTDGLISSEKKSLSVCLEKQMFRFSTTFVVIVAVVIFKPWKYL